MQLNFDDIGEKIRKERKKRGITQESLSEMADISTQHLSRIERNVRKPSLETVHRIASALGVEPEYLTGECEIIQPDYLEELERLWEDCSDYEKNVIGEILISTKKSIRKNLPLLKNEK